jgi:hypothetical protein
MPRQTDRRVRELIKRYRLEPGLRDVFVEGRGDARQPVSYYLRERGLDRGVVYSVDTVDVPAGEVLVRGYPNNNKGRVLTLAALINEDLGPGAQFTGIVDVDLDRTLGGPPYPGGILATDFASMEAYLLDDMVVSRFCGMFLGLAARVGPLLTSVGEACRRLWSIRAADARLGWQMRRPALGPSLAWDGSGIAFDREDYVRRLLQANAHWQDRVVFAAVVEVEDAALPSDPRNCVQGHDFICILRWYANSFTRPHIPLSSEHVRRALWTSLDIASMDGYDLFRGLRERLG